MEDGTWRVSPAPLRIEVKVLVGGEPGAKGTGRRISKAAFAQIRAAELLDPRTAAPNGVPLARIHLPSEDCEQKPMEDEHVHVLWQQGTELRFSCVLRCPWSDEGPERRHQRTLDYELSRDLQNLRWRHATLDQASEDLRMLGELRCQAAGEAPPHKDQEEAHEEDDDFIYLYVRELPPHRRLAYEEKLFLEKCALHGQYHGLGLRTDSEPKKVHPAREALDEDIRRLELRREEFRDSWREAFDRLADLEQVYVGL